VCLLDQRPDELGIPAQSFEAEGVHDQLRETAASPESEFTSAMPGYCSW
jgi:hypothetical protein